MSVDEINDWIFVLQTVGASRFSLTCIRHVLNLDCKC